MILLALLLAQISQQTVSPVGRPSTSAVTVQTDPAAPLAVTGRLSVSGTADLPGNTATFNANNVCTAVLTAGEQSAGFHLTAGTLDATFTAYVTNQIGAINCATAGTCTSIPFSSGSSIVVTNPNGVKDVGISVVGGTRQVQVCTTTFTSGSAPGVVTATFVQAASSGGGGGGAVTQATDPWLVAGKGTAGTPSGGVVTVQGVASMTPLKVDGSGVTQPISGTVAATESGTWTVQPGNTANTTAWKVDGSAVTQPISATALPLPAGAATEATLAGVKTGTDKIPASPSTDRTTAAGPFSSRLSDGAAFYKATTPADTQPISAASLPLPSGAATEATLAGVKTGTDKIPASPSTDRTTAAGPFSVRISTGAAFVDPTQIRALTVADIVTVAQGAAGASAWLVTGTGGTFPVTGTFWQATQPISGTVTATQATGTNLHMVCDSGCTPGGSFADGSAFTAGSTAINVSGGVYDDTLGAITTGNAGSPRITTKRAFHVNLRDALGNEITSLGSKLTDGEYGIAQAKVLTTAQAPQAKDSALVVAISPNSVVNIGTNNLLVKPTLTLQGPVTRTQVVDPSGRPATVLGPNRAPNGSENAQVFIQSPIPVPTCPLTAALSQTASSTTIPGVAGKITYICKVFVVSTTAQSISLTEGTGSACGTGALALAGHTTVANGMGLAANGGWVEGNGVGIVYTARKLGDDVCVLQSGAGNVAGSISYVQF